MEQRVNYMKYPSMFCLKSVFLSCSSRTKRLCDSGDVIASSSIVLCFENYQKEIKIIQSVCFSAYYPIWQLGLNGDVN